MNEIDTSSVGKELSDTAGRMKPSIKKRWIDALESGDYDQAIGSPFLRREYEASGPQLKTQWNALGVLCDVMNIPCVKKTYGRLIVYEYDGADSYLTPRVCAQAGFKPQRGAFVARIYIDQTIFAQGYDIKNLSSSGVPFRALAKLIREQL